MYTICPHQTDPDDLHKKLNKMLMFSCNIPRCFGPVACNGKLFMNSERFGFFQTLNKMAGPEGDKSVAASEYFFIFVFEI